MEYYKQKKEDEFVRILETARTDANTMYRDSEKDQASIFPLFMSSHFCQHHVSWLWERPGKDGTL